MIYLIFLLLFITFLFSLVILYKEIIRGLASRNNKNSLEHDDLVELIEELGYDADDGICFGFTVTWALAAAMERESIYYQRLDLIRGGKDNLVKKVISVSEKIKKQQTISIAEYSLTEIRPFVESICLAQSPEDYEDFYAKPMNQSKFANILRMIRNTTAEHIFIKTVAFSSRKDVNSYLFQLGRAQKVKDNIVMILCCDDHAVGLKKYRDSWLFIDINALYNQSLDYPYLLLTDKGLCHQLYLSFGESNCLIFSTHFITKNFSRELKDNLRQFDNLYPVSCQQVRYLNNRKMDFLNVCIRNGDVNCAQKIINLNIKYNLLSQEQIRNAIEHAIAIHQNTILALLVKTPGFNINMPCSTTGQTPLAFACAEGQFETVKLLLSCPRVSINARDKKGNTPLMMACKSRSTHRNTELFILLLKAGASLKQINFKGMDALTIAMMYGNKSAIVIIKKFNKAKPLSCTQKSQLFKPSNRRKKSSPQHTNHRYSMFSLIANPSSQARTQEFTNQTLATL